METLHAMYDSAWEAAQNVALKVMDGGLLHRDAPFSPRVPPELAANMPDLTGRVPLTLPWDRIEPIDPERHYVWLLDNTAFRASSADQDVLATIRADAEDSDEVDPVDTSFSPDAWQAEFVAAYFVKDSGKDISVVLAHLCRKLNVERGSASELVIKKRVQHFVDTILPRHTVEIQADRTAYHLGPSSSMGISSELKTTKLSTVPVEPALVSVPSAMHRPLFLPGAITFAEPAGWGLISDIDDTIKITQTNSPLGILKTTFLDEPQPVAGMPELYAHLKTSLADPSVFYLSASPYNLYPFLRIFRTKYYPHGTIILRDASWQNLGGLVSSLTQDVQDYKVDRMRKIHAWFPQRKFICIGDSTQKDPESYGEIARTYPGWVKGIFIRKVEGLSDLSDPDQQEKNSPQRFEEAFRGLDAGLWQVFTDPRDVKARIDEFVKQGV